MQNAVEKRMRRDVDAARGEEAGAALEQVERGVDLDVGVARERAQFGGRLVGIAGDPQEALDQQRHFMRQRRLRAERGLFEEAVGDLADRAAADGVDAGDRQEVGDQRVRRLGIGARQRREHALVFRARAGGLDREHVEVALERGPSRLKSLTSRRFQAGARSSAVDQRGEQADVAHADFGRGHAVTRRVASSPSESISASAAAVSVRPNDSMPACRNSLGPSSPWRKTGPR